MNNRPFNDWCCPECGAFLSSRAILQSEAEPLLDAHYESERQSQIMVRYRERGAARLPEDRPTRRALYLGTVASRAAGASLSRHRISAPPAPAASATLMDRPSPVVRASKNVWVVRPRRTPEPPEKVKCEVCHRVMPYWDLPKHLKRFCSGGPQESVTRLPFRLLPPGERAFDQILGYYQTRAHRWLAS
jgi:hypothetical protein